MTLVGKLDAWAYPQFLRNWDDEIFRERILVHLRKDSIVLDLGAGAGIVAAMNFRGLAAKVCGVDLDPRVQENPFLDEGKISDAGEIPYPDNVFDIVFSDNVMEHLDAPENVFREIVRVLKPGGMLLFKTPNRMHYMPLIARSTPLWFHQYMNRLRGRREVDTFPTRYKANSAKQIKRVANAAGFRVSKIEFLEGRPEYLRIFFLTYLLGLFYERVVNSTSLLSRFRILIIAELQKNGITVSTDTHADRDAKK